MHRPTTITTSLLHKGWPSATRIDKVNAVLAPHRAYLTCYSEPGMDRQSRRCWVEHPNDGLSEQRAQEMRRDLEHAGLWPIVPEEG